jgi:hypothetical protein
MPTIDEIKKMEKVWLYPKHPSNKSYKGYYPVSGIRQIARDIKEFMPDLPLELTLGTAAKESTLGKAHAVYGLKNLGDTTAEYMRWKARPRNYKEIVMALKHPKYLKALTDALDEGVRTNPDYFLNEKFYDDNTGQIRIGTNTEIRDRNIVEAYNISDELREKELSARFAGMKLREGMQKYKGDLGKAAQWYNFNEPERAERVLDLGRTALSHPEVRAILKEEGLLE